MELKQALDVVGKIRQQYQALEALGAVLEVAEKSDRWAAEATKRLEDRKLELASVNASIEKRRTALADMERQYRDRSTTLKQAQEEAKSKLEKEQEATEAKLKASIVEIEQTKKGKVEYYDQLIGERKKELLGVEGELEAHREKLTAAYRKLEAEHAKRSAELESATAEKKARLDAVTKEFDALLKRMSK